VPFVDRVAHRLPDEVVGQGLAREPVVGEQLPLFPDVAVVHGIDVEMVAPAGEFDAVIAHALRERRELLKRVLAR